MRAIGPGVSTRLLCALLALGLAAAPTSARPTAPSMELSVTQDDDQVVLSWKVPEGEAPDAFRVYRDGRLAAVVDPTSATVPAASAYTFTSLYGNVESAPAVAAESPGSDQTWCDPLPITIDETTPPFLFPKPQPDCFNWVFDIVEEILGNTPSVPLQAEIEVGIE